MLVQTINAKGGSVFFVCAAASFNPHVERWLTNELKSPMLLMDYDGRTHAV